jgi:hypothetical protein
MRLWRACGGGGGVLLERRQGCWCSQHPSGKSPFVRNALNQRRKRDVIMSFIMNSEGNKEFKKKTLETSKELKPRGCLSCPGEDE